METLEIHVHVEALEAFNATLVDLSGQLAPAPGSDGPATVERIVKNYVKMSGSLLLYIVPTNQDYNTVLGKVIVDPHVDKTIYVLTKRPVQAWRGGGQVAARRDRRRNQRAARRGAGKKSARARRRRKRSLLLIPLFHSESLRGRDQVRMRRPGVRHREAHAQAHL